MDATLKALDAFPGGLWVILGGKDKGSDYTVLRAPLAAKARAVLLIGAAAAKIAEQLRRRGAAGTCRKRWRPRCATRIAHAQPGDTVLLAPACASFDQFESFEHRGQVFKSLVQATGARTLIWRRRLKTDWILFGTTIGDGGVRRGDAL